jgi:hypothetical protein
MSEGKLTDAPPLETQQHKRRFGTLRMEGSITIYRSVEEVFAFVSRPEHLQLSWSARSRQLYNRYKASILLDDTREYRPPRVTYTRLTTGPLGTGTRIEERVSLASKPHWTLRTSLFQIIEYDPPHLVTYQRTFSGIIKLQDIMSYQLEPQATSTQVNCTHTGRLQGWSWLLWPLAAISPINHRWLKGDLSALKTTLESLPPSALSSSADMASHPEQSLL